MADTVPGLPIPYYLRPPALADPTAAPMIPTSVAMPSAPLPALRMPVVPGISVNRPAPAIPLPVTPTQRDTAALNALKASPSGIDQISNPWLRQPAKAADIALQIAGSVFAPARALDMILPGTALHHDVRVNQMERQVANDQATDANAAKLAQMQASTRQTDQDTANSAIPKLNYQQTDDGLVAIPQGGTTATPVLGPNGEQLGKAGGKEAPALTLAQMHAAAVNKAIAENRDPSTDPTVGHLADAILSTQPGQNKAPKITYQTVNGPDGKPHVYAMDESGNKVADEGTHYERPMAVKIDVGAGAGANSPAMEAQAQQIANGDVKPPSLGRNNPYNRALLQRVYEINPKYSDSLYSATQDLRSNKPNSMGANVGRLGTAILHGDEALKNSASLGFSPALMTGVGTAGAAAYKESAEFLTGEVGQYVEGGKLTVDQGNHIRKDLLSPVQGTRDAAVNQIIKLSGGKLQSQMESFKNSTQNDFPTERVFNDPQIASALQRHGITGQPSAGSPPPSGMTVSLADARSLPQNRGKSDAEISADIKAHGHAVRP